MNVVLYDSYTADYAAAEFIDKNYGWREGLEGFENEEPGYFKSSMYDDYGLAYSSSLPAADPHPQVTIPGYIPKNKNVPQGMWMDEKAFSDGLQWVHGGLNDTDEFMQPKQFYNYEVSQSSKGCVGAGAFGVIGAVATTSANTAVSFNVTDALGTWSWIGRSFDKPANTSISFGFAGGGTALPIITSVTSAAEFSVYRQPSWGPDATPWAWNTSVLAVMLYHAWPREQTIYDSRFMAVHHFNPDVETMDLYHNLKDVVDGKDVVNPNNQGSYITRQVLATGVSKGGNGITDAVVASGTMLDVLDDDGETVETEIFVDQIGSAVDYRVPSYYDIKNGQIKVMTTGTIVYNDTVEAAPAEGEIITLDQKNMVLDSENWKVSSDRRGKLLPYTYYPITIGIGFPNENLALNQLFDIDMGVYDSESPALGRGYVRTGQTGGGGGHKVTYWTNEAIGELKGNDVEAVLENVGTGYQVGDTFRLSTGSGIIIEVKEVFPADPAPNGGGVAKIRIYSDADPKQPSRGVNLTPEDFINGNDEIGPGTTSNVGVEPISVNGEGFEFYFTRGVVTGGTAVVDEKPKLASSSRYQVISQQPPGNTLKAATDDVGYGQQNRTVSIAIENPSEDNRYDIFFRFHNDVSHTIMSDNWCVHNGGERLGTQQFCDVTITAV